jgi:hypothetical protein
MEGAGLEAERTILFGYLVIWLFGFGDYLVPHIHDESTRLDNQITK